MKGLLKNLGLLVILAGVGILIGCAATKTLDNNALLGTSLALIVGGFIAYIAINKKVTD